MTRHIRKTNLNVTDHRFRGTAMYANKPRPVFCGAEPSGEDLSKGTGLHYIKHSTIKPEWLSDVCPNCLQKLKDAVK